VTYQIEPEPILPLAGHGSTRIIIKAATQAWFLNTGTTTTIITRQKTSLALWFQISDSHYLLLLALLRTS
jgi:hypothetical protein